ASEPDVEAVLLDPLISGRVATAGAFATEPPSHAIDGDVVLASQTWICELKRRRYRANSAPEDDYFFRSSRGLIVGQACHSTRPAPRVIEKSTAIPLSVVCGARPSSLAIGMLANG